MIIPEPGIQKRFTVVHSVLIPEEVQPEQDREGVRIQIKHRGD